MFLIIGANGQIGSQLAKRLTAGKHKVRALVRDTKKAANLSGVEIVAGDLNDVASLDKAMQGVKGVFVLSAGDAIPLEKNAFAAAKRAGVQHVVLLSVAGAQKGSPIRLADMHGESEAALQASGVPAYTILQPTMFMSNVLGSLGSIKGEGKIYGAMKEGRVPLIDPSDIAATAAAILSSPAGHEGKTYALTGPEPLTQAQVAEKVSKAAGKTVTYVDLTVQAFVDALQGAGFPAWVAEDFGKMHAWFATDGGAQVSDGVARVTGSAPRTFDGWLADNGAALR